MDKQIIEIEHAEKSFGDLKVLQDIQFIFESGRIYGLIGRNGSGKSVLFKCICGFISLSKGRIIQNGKVIGSDIDFLQNAGILIEGPGLLGNYSGYENLKMLADINAKASKKEIRETIKLVGLDPDSKKPVKQYSMGMKQRLGIAQAIMEDPDILLLDEPMNGLDHHGVHEMRQLLLALKQQGKLIVLSSHNIEDIKVLCDEVYEIDHGLIRVENDKITDHIKTTKS